MDLLPKFFKNITYDSVKTHLKEITDEFFLENEEDDIFFVQIALLECIFE